MPERYEGQYEANLNAYEISLKYTVAERRQILSEMREWQKRALEAEAKLDVMNADLYAPEKLAPFDRYFIEILENARDAVKAKREQISDDRYAIDLLNSLTKVLEEEFHTANCLDELV